MTRYWHDPESPFVEMRALHVWLRAVKWCRTCQQMLPIEQFRVPTESYYKGWLDCITCCRRRERSRPRMKSVTRTGLAFVGGSEFTGAPPNDMQIRTDVLHGEAVV